MPRLRARDQDSSAKRFSDYQDETFFVRLALSHASMARDAIPNITLALSATIYGKPTRLLTDWSQLFTRALGVVVNLSHQDVLQGEFLTFREAWQIACDDSRVRARVAYLDGIAPGFSQTQTGTTGSITEVQPDDSRGDDNSANLLRQDPDWFRD